MTKKKVIGISVDQEVYDYLKDLADKAHMTLSSFCNMWFATAMVDLEEEDPVEVNPATLLIKKLF